MFDSLCTAILTIIISTIFSFSFGPFVQRIGMKFNIIDIPNIRKIHTKPIVRIGGVCIFLTFILYFLSIRIFLDFALLNKDVLQGLNTIFIGAFLFFIIGIHDDIYKSSPLFRLGFQFAIAFIVSINGININSINFYFPYFGNINFELPLIIRYIISSFWIVGITNSINWLDGIDGLAAGYSSIISISLCSLMIFNGNIIGVLFFSILFGSTFGFLIRNIKPAFFIMGDCGSNFLGFSLATSSLLFLNYSGSFSNNNILYLMFIFSLPILDMTIVILNRLLSGKNIFLPDKSHIHHRLMQLNFGYKKIIFLLYFYSFFSALIGISLIQNA